MPGTNDLITLYEEKWQNHEPLEITTSGSTGVPKTWIYQHDLLIWSAKQTRKHFIPQQVSKQLIALPLDKAGGFFQWVRSKVWGIPYDVVEPTSNPLASYEGQANLASFTPMQARAILNYESSKARLAQFKAILIGGAPIDENLEQQLCTEFPDIKWVHTFGMTETYSHFAGRILGEEHYRCIDNTEIRTDETGRLHVKNPTTQGWLQTHDLINILSPSSFQWIGRSDFSINSGGVKIQLESVENEIRRAQQWNEDDFFCWWEEDEQLGQALVAYLKKGFTPPEHWGVTRQHTKPRIVRYFDQLIRTKTGKIHREKTSKFSVQEKGKHK